MAYQMIHMEIAYRLLECFPQIRDRAEFLLGSLAPDSVHMNPDYEVGMKVRSHMFEECGPWGDTQDYERWDRNIRVVLDEISGLSQESGTGYRSYLLGMCVHCLTDYRNDLYIWRYLQKEFIPRMGFDLFKKDYYVEARGIDCWLYQNSPYTAKIRSLLATAESYEVADMVNKQEVEQMRHHLLYVQYDAPVQDISGYRFLSADFLEGFLQRTVTEIAAQIQDVICFVTDRQGAAF